MKLVKKITALAVFCGLCIAAAGCSTATTYTVTYDSAGGSEVKAVKVEENKKAKAPTAPTRAGYDFVGWTLDDEPFDFTSPVTEDTELVAEWKARTDTPYTVLVFAEQDDGSYQDISSDSRLSLDSKGQTDFEIKVGYLDYQRWGIDKITTHTVDAFHPNAVMNGTIKADGSLVLQIYLK